MAATESAVTRVYIQLDIPASAPRRFLWRVSMAASGRTITRGGGGGGAGWLAGNHSEALKSTCNQVSFGVLNDTCSTCQELATSNNPHFKARGGS